MSDQMPPEGDTPTTNTHEHGKTAQATAEAHTITAPEQGLGASSPEPNYPHYRVRPGALVMLASLDPAVSEGYKRKKDAEGELERQRKRTSDLQDRLYGEGKRTGM